MLARRSFLAGFVGALVAPLGVGAAAASTREWLIDYSGDEVRWYAVNAPVDRISRLLKACNEQIVELDRKYERDVELAARLSTDAHPLIVRVSLPSDAFRLV